MKIAVQKKDLGDQIWTPLKKRRQRYIKIFHFVPPKQKTLHKSFCENVTRKTTEHEEKKHDFCSSEMEF